jgi:copper(I)-binding protein
MSTPSRMMMFVTLAAVLGIGFSYAQSSGLISIEKPFSRATPGGSKIGAGYMTITNKGTAPRRFVRSATLFWASHRTSSEACSTSANM